MSFPENAFIAKPPVAQDSITHPLTQQDATTSVLSTVAANSRPRSSRLATDLSTDPRAPASIRTGFVAAQVGSNP